MRALRGIDPEVATELTYPVTQSSLQAKHDAAEAKHKYEMVMGPARDLWRGRLMEHSGPGVWTPVYKDGEPIQAEKDEWVAQFVEMYEAKDGLNVNIDPQMAIRAANALADPETGVMRNSKRIPASLSLHLIVLPMVERSRILLIWLINAQGCLMGHATHSLPVQARHELFIRRNASLLIRRRLPDTLC